MLMALNPGDSTGSLYLSKWNSAHIAARNSPGRTNTSGALGAALTLQRWTLLDYIDLTQQIQQVSPPAILTLRGEFSQDRQCLKTR
jgi:hypothetical protein